MIAKCTAVTAVQAVWLLKCGYELSNSTLMRIAYDSALTFYYIYTFNCLMTVGPTLEVTAEKTDLQNFVGGRSAHAVDLGIIEKIACDTV
jgi:hypothetical protein